MQDNLIKNYKEGFTLIELLVVISIIGLLSSVVLASLQEARVRAQYKAFDQELLQLTNALELYRTDNGEYPPSSTFINTSVLVSTYLTDYISAGVVSKYLPNFMYYSPVLLSGPGYSSDYGCGNEGKPYIFTSYISSTNNNFIGKPSVPEIIDNTLLVNAYTSPSYSPSDLTCYSRF